MQSHVRVQHHEDRGPAREAGAALRWGAVVALLLMLAVLGWAVRRGERPSVERGSAPAVTRVEPRAPSGPAVRLRSLASGVRETPTDRS
jgi:hypothetical protein